MCLTPMSSACNKGRLAAGEAAAFSAGVAGHLLAVGAEPSLWCCFISLVRARLEARKSLFGPFLRGPKPEPRNEYSKRVALRRSDL